MPTNERERGLQCSDTLGEKDKLLRCPFCGGKATVEHGFAQRDKTMDYDLFYAEVICDNRILCEARISQYLNDEQAAIKNVINQWNKRVPSPQSSLANTKSDGLKPNDCGDFEHLLNDPRYESFWKQEEKEETET